MIRIASPVLALFFLVGPASGDSLDRLQTDPKPSASERLAELYKQTPDVDQRFWIIHALGVRLNEHNDPAALETLIAVAQEESVEGVRVPALRALADFSAQPRREMSTALLARLDAVASKGANAPSPFIREGAENLKRFLEIKRNPDRRTTPLPPEPATDRRWAKVVHHLLKWMRWLWLLVLPGVVVGWALLGLPVFEIAGEKGARARAAWGVLTGQKLFLLLTVFLWLCLSAMLAGYGFDLLVLAIGHPLVPVPASWLKAYFAAGLCLFLPGALLAAGLARRPGGGAAIACLQAVPGAMVLWIVVFTFLAPMEVFYRIFLRRSVIRSDSGLLTRLLETGALRTGFLASSVMACEDMGVVPALRRSRELIETGEGKIHLGLGAFDLRFALLCAAPVLAFFCALIAKGQPVRWSVSMPLVLLGCSIWSWAVLVGVLYAVIETLEGVTVAQYYRSAVETDLNEWGEL